MAILEKETFHSEEFGTGDFTTSKQVLKMLDGTDYQEELKTVLGISEKNTQVYKIGNSKQLLEAINILDKQCSKEDIVVKRKNVHLKKLLEGEKAIFEIFGIDNKYLLKENKSDLLEAETTYSAKTDLLDYYHFNKFANYCSDLQYEDLVGTINRYLIKVNQNNDEGVKLRILHKTDDKKFYIRATTSPSEYKNFGINFSVAVALASLDKYVESAKHDIYISNYCVDDSSIYVCFTFKNPVPVASNISLTFSLILENDELKRGAVSFNGLFKLTITEKGKTSQIYLKPEGIKKDKAYTETDLLTYAHRGNGNTVMEKISELPSLIDYFIKQVSEDAKKIALIKSPDSVRSLIFDKIKFARQEVFSKKYKEQFKKRMSISVDSLYKLFELLREVDELFENDDVISRDYWRQKLYRTLIDRK
ncbi:hypothetical protein ACLOAU_04650 [Niabella sp. CJ426]|uniref:hypothetical protein n=1 Tax=Niabella sp. CJ426 TaxID=3393740 RepID=UPI003CFECFD7